MNKWIGIVWLLCLGMIACDDPATELLPPTTQTWEITIEDNEISSQGRYYSFYTHQQGETDTTLVVETTAAWCTLMSEVLPTDGILQVKVEANEEAKSREASIKVYSQSTPEHTATLTIRQRGLGNDNENDGDADPLSDYRVGWGFNVFDEYKSLSSLRGRVIDPNRLAVFDSDTTFHSLQEVVHERESFKVYSTQSIQEMSSVLTKEMTSETKFLGAKKTTRRYSKVCKQSLTEQAYSYVRLQKTVASRSMDAGALQYIASLPDGIAVDALPFTDGFKQYYQAIVSATNGGERGKWIQQMVDRYGTHIVVEASVGCMIDLVLTFDKKSSYDLETVSEETGRRILGRSSSSSSSQATEHMTCDIQNEHSFQVKGGSAATQHALLSAIAKLTSTSQLQPQLIQQWLGSVTSSSLTHERQNLDVVDFRFLPIWDLFADATVRSGIQAYVMAMSQRSDCGFTDYELSTDNYCIDLTDSRYYQFGQTLVKILYQSNVPIMQACEEYVPKIRTDKRITVFYPIVNRKVQIGQGLFPGDGEGNRPAYLTFSGGDVYVNPIDGYGHNDVLKKAYYMHGNLYDEDYGMAFQSVRNWRIDEHFLQVWDHPDYPVVKIGSGYWSRCYLTNKMYFKTLMDDGYTWLEGEVIEDGVLFADVSWGIEDIYKDFIERDFSYEYITDPAQRTHWSFPYPSDRENLVRYLGNNLKVLFPGQVSGFDAQFKGHIPSQPFAPYFPDKQEEQGEKCYIVFTSLDEWGSSHHYSLVLNSDYTWSSKLVYADDEFLPIRLFHSEHYIY